MLAPHEPVWSTGRSSRVMTTFFTRSKMLDEFGQFGLGFFD